MRTYTDEYLDYWADRYIERQAAAYGITLETWLANAHELDRLLSGSAGALPLLLAQRMAQRAIERAEADAERFPRRNGAPFEPLHHHAYPRTRLSDFEFIRRQRHERH